MEKSVKFLQQNQMKGLTNRNPTTMAKRTRTTGDGNHRAALSKRRKILESDMEMAFRLQIQETMSASLALAIKPSKPRLASAQPISISKPKAPPPTAATAAASKLIRWSKALTPRAAKRPRLAPNPISMSKSQPHTAATVAAIPPFTPKPTSRSQALAPMAVTASKKRPRLAPSLLSISKAPPPTAVAAAVSPRLAPKPILMSKALPPTVATRPWLAPEPISGSKALPSTGATWRRSRWMNLYCKGLVSREMGRAGAGIAICDDKDSVIFAGRKGLLGLVGVGVRFCLSSEAAELQALVEGLKQALNLELKVLTFYLDNKSIYGYIMNGRLPGSSTVTNLVNQVSLLRKKFHYCRPLLVASQDMKFASQFAAEAMHSSTTSVTANTIKFEPTEVLNQRNIQVTKLVTQGTSLPRKFQSLVCPVVTSKCKSTKKTCSICFEDTDIARMFSIATCAHKYCVSCMKRHVEVKLQSGMVPRCPHQGCQSQVNVSRCKAFLESKLVDEIRGRIKESSIPVTEKVYCPYPKCSALMSEKEVLDYTKTSFVSEGGRKCMTCHFYFCINCKVPWHYEMTCADYKRSKAFVRTDDHMVKSLATKNLWRQCSKCNHMIELGSGCYHMTCRCGYQFCYTCGAEWKNTKTCRCQFWSVHHITRRP